MSEAKLSRPAAIHFNYNAHGARVRCGRFKRDVDQMTTDLHLVTCERCRRAMGALLDVI